MRHHYNTNVGRSERVQEPPGWERRRVAGLLEGERKQGRLEPKIDIIVLS
jgi:hypothetical protein